MTDDDRDAMASQPQPQPHAVQPSLGPRRGAALSPAWTSSVSRDRPP
jgi:hypothetical protein